MHCYFTAGTSGMRTGMFTTAQIEIKNGDGLLAPEDAVVRWQDDNYVFLRKANGQFERVPVNCGSPVDGKVEIKSTSGNPIKDSLIIENAYAALMKMENKSE